MRKEIQSHSILGSIERDEKDTQSKQGVTIPPRRQIKFSTHEKN